MSSCSNDTFDMATYCGNAGVTVGYAVDSQGVRLDEFGPDDKRRSYLRLATMSPKSVRQDWETIAGSFVATSPSLSLIASQERVTQELKKDCGLTVTVF